MSVPQNGEPAPARRWFRLTIAELLWLAALCALATGFAVRVLRSFERTKPAQLAFSPDGRLLAAGFERGDTLLWDVSAEQPRKLGSIHAELPYDNSKVLQFTGQDTLAFIDWDEPQPNLVFWDVRRNRLVKTARWPQEAYGGGILSRDGQTIVGHSFFSDKIAICKVEQGTVRVVITGPGGAEIVAFSEDGRRLIAGEDGRIEVFDVETGRRESVTPMPYLGFYREVSPDGRHLLSDSSNGSWILHVVNREGHVSQSIDGYNDHGPTCFSADSRRVAVSTVHGVQIWDIATGKLVRRFEPQAGIDEDLAISPDGRTLVIAERECISLWDINSGRHLADVWTPNNALLPAGLFSLGFIGWALVWGWMRRRRARPDAQRAAKTNTTDGANAAQPASEPLLVAPRALVLCWRLMLLGGAAAIFLLSYLTFEIGPLWPLFSIGIANGMFFVVRGVGRHTRWMRLVGLLQVLNLFAFDPINPILGLPILVLLRTRGAREYRAAVG